MDDEGHDHQVVYTTLLDGGGSAGISHRIGCHRRLVLWSNGNFDPRHERYSLRCAAISAWTKGVAIGDR